MSGIVALLLRLMITRHVDLDTTVPDPLSLELWEAIIDQLEALPDGRKSLQACSLTCKAWVPRSRYHIYRHLELGPNYKSRFLRIFSMSEMNGALLHTLQIRGTITGRSTQWMNVLFPAMATRLINVKDLGFELLEFDKLNKDSHESFLKEFQNVEVLRIKDTKFTSLAQLVTLIASFPALRVLECDTVRMKDERWPAHDVKQIPASLNTLRLSGFLSKTTFINWFIALDPIPSISTLSVTHPYDVAYDLTMLLYKLGPQVRHLTFGSISNYYMYDGIGTQGSGRYNIEIKYSTRLRSIQLDILWKHPPWKWVPTILAQITSTRLEEVRLDFIIESLGNLHHFEWDDVDCLLSGEQQLPKLTRVYVNITNTTVHAADAYATEDVVEYVRARLPLLGSRMRLRLEICCYVSR